jgi:membrane protein
LLKNLLQVEKILSAIKYFWKILKDAAADFLKDNAIKLSASLSYYTIFSLPPLLIIIISLIGIFLGTEAVEGEIFSQIRSLVGENAALQIQEAIKNVKFSRDNFLAALVGGLILLIGASGVFAEIQSSINYVWGIEAKPRKGLIKYLKNRLMSFSMIGSAGFLLLVSLIVNALMDVLKKRLAVYFPDITVYLFYALNLLVIFAIITLLFSLIFKTLPDGRVLWKDALAGSGFTALLFMIGKFAIGAYLGRSSIASVYGAAGSLVIILAWVYYSAIILYFGAEFTKALTKMRGHKIIPNEYSVKIGKPRPVTS